MNQIQIQGTGIQIKEYNDQRVVTFKDIDTVHKRPDGTARKRFSDNRKRFIEGVDYYKVKCSEVRPFFGQTPPNGFNPDGDITLITESGYLMLVKSFTDDLAWEVQRELVDTYFRARVNPDENTMKGIIDSGVKTVVVATDNLIQCAEIMAGCLDGNRKYVLNILRNIVPNIDDDGEITDKVVIEKPVETKKRACYEYLPQPVDIDVTKMLLEMTIQNMSLETLAEKSVVSVNTVINWIRGKHRPTKQNRINVCVALGKDENFLTPKRKRNVR